jgi:hypothetical protein
MKTENRYYDIFPRVVRAGTRTRVTIRPRFAHVGFEAHRTYPVCVYPAQFYPASGGEQPAVMSAVPRDGRIEIAPWFAEEQEYIVELAAPSGDRAAPLLRTFLYAVREDLHGLLPLKGDPHLHSCKSDGKESPAFVAAACRRTGLDFMALTDHGQYLPSLEARQAFAGIDQEFLICPGEEIHPPGNPVHMVNFGGCFSVNERFQTDPDTYQGEVRALAAGLTEVTDGDVRHQLASCTWVFDQIRRGGGLGLFCHPYWHVRWGYTPAAPVTAALFDRQPFDAYEVVGGYSRTEVDSNTLQIARYHEERAKGKAIPIVGASDAHGCENSDLFGWYYTLVLADQFTPESIIAGIKQLRSVAVEAIPGEAARVYGPLRLVQFALFLLREVLPGHDEFCREEGRLMLDYLDGDRKAGGELSSKEGRTRRFFARYAGVSDSATASA